jgi:hypothetical protein
MIKKGTHRYTSEGAGDDRIEGERLGTLIPETDWGAIYIHPNVQGDWPASITSSAALPHGECQDSLSPG